MSDELDNNATADPTDTSKPATETSDQPSGAYGALRDFGPAFISVVIGTLSLTFALSFTIIPLALEVQSIGAFTQWITGIIGIAFLVSGVVLGIRAMKAKEQRTVEEHTARDSEEEHVEDWPERKQRISQERYGTHLVGIGFALLLQALITTLVVLAMIWSMNQDPLPIDAPHSPLVGDAFDGAAADHAAGETEACDKQNYLGRLFGKKPCESRFVAVLLVLSTFMVLLGALFFFATTLWTKMNDSEPEDFSSSRFWGGLWFRLGEAVVFNLVIFLALRSYADQHYVLLPIIALLIGMFLKAGEQLISGLAKRVFAAFLVLLPIEEKPLAQMKLEIVSTAWEGEEKDQEEAFNRAVAACSKLRGVERATGNPATGEIRVLYDPRTIRVVRIHQEIEMMGFRLV